jgi:hypothetical protein
LSDPLSSLDSFVDHFEPLGFLNHFEELGPIAQDALACLPHLVKSLTDLPRICHLVNDGLCPWVVLLIFYGARIHVLIIVVEDVHHLVRLCIFVHGSQKGFIIGLSSGFGVRGLRR